jgi:hypothetical protein
MVVAENQWDCDNKPVTHACRCHLSSRNWSPRFVELIFFACQALICQIKKEEIGSIERDRPEKHESDSGPGSAFRNKWIVVRHRQKAAFCTCDQAENCVGNCNVGLSSIVMKYRLRKTSPN